MSDLETVYDAVLFDMDGVLLQGRSTSETVYQRATEDALQLLNVEPRPEQRTTLQQPRYSPIVAMHCRELGIDPERFWRLREHCASAREHRRLAAGQRKPHTDVNALLQFDCPKAIVSNNRHATVEFVQQHLFAGLFVDGRGRDPTIDGYRHRKPDSAYLEEMLQTLDVDDALYVGDRETDIQAAKAAGVDVAFLLRESANVESPDLTPTYEITSLRDLQRLHSRQRSVA